VVCGNSLLHNGLLWYLHVPRAPRNDGRESSNFFYPLASPLFFFFFFLFSGLRQGGGRGNRGFVYWIVQTSSRRTSPVHPKCARTPVGALSQRGHRVGKSVAHPLMEYAGAFPPPLLSAAGVARCCGAPAGEPTPWVQQDLVRYFCTSPCGHICPSHHPFFFFLNREAVQPPNLPSRTHPRCKFPSVTGSIRTIHVDRQAGRSSITPTGSRSNGLRTSSTSLPSIFRFQLQRVLIQIGVSRRSSLCIRIPTRTVRRHSVSNQQYWIPAIHVLMPNEGNSPAETQWVSMTASR